MPHGRSLACGVGDGFAQTYDCLANRQAQRGNSFPRLARKHGPASSEAAEDDARDRLSIGANGLGVAQYAQRFRRRLQLGHRGTARDEREVGNEQQCAGAFRQIGRTVGNHEVMLRLQFASSLQDVVGVDLP